MNSSEKASKLALICSMLIFGTIGIFRKYIPVSSSMLAMIRGYIGMLFLVFLVLITRKKISWQLLKSNLLLLVLSGAAIGFNWVLLFEAYKYTSVATATLCYYTAPIIVILASPIFFNEHLTLKKISCIVTVLIGMILVSGVLSADFGGISELKGIICGLGAAVLYASAIILNKKSNNVPAYDKTIVQLGIAAVVVHLYILFTKNMENIKFTPFIIIMILIVGIVHTGFSYALYFASIKDLKTQTVALFSYIDPISAIILSALFLHENMSIIEIVGAVLVLGGTIISDMS